MPRLRALLLPFVLVLVAAPAQARTYWVSPTGVSGASGVDSLSNATTLAWFNANAVAGDVCRFRSGTYVDPVQPAHDGTAASRIRYYGFPQDPGGVTVADVHFGYAHGSYSTARWLRTSGGITGCYAAASVYPVGDSIASVWTTNGNSGISVLGKACVFDSLRITGTINGTGQTHWIDMYIGGTPGPWFTTSNVISNCVFTPTVNTTSGQGDVHVVGMGHGVENKFINNTFNITVNSVAGYFFPVELYEGYRNQFQRNTWNINFVGAALGSRGVWSHRDSSSYNRYFDNTVTVTGTGGNISFMLSNPGAFPGTTGHNYYGNNTIRDDAAQGGTGVFWFYDGSRQDTIQFNTIRTSAGIPCVTIAGGGQVNGTVFRHNTYYTSGRVAFDCANTVAVNSPRCVSEIYYCQTANASGAENARVSSGFAMDSSGVYFTPTGTAGRALYVGGVDGTPGSGGSYGLPGAALWGSPRFADSTYATFDPHLLSGSFGALSTLSGGYAGAMPSGAPSLDTTPPAAVTDLALSASGPTSLSMGWTAPGDNGMTGTAALYDMRWSTSPINDANFSGANAGAGMPAPATAGTRQSWTASGLASGSTYYFALRTRDAAGNWSATSNLASGTTTSVDTIPPAAVQDLSAGP